MSMVFSKFWVVAPDDRDYPSSLLGLTSRPPKLYGLGAKVFNPTSIAVVGSRKPTEYGAGVTRRFTTSWALAGIDIVSGLALGIDSVAHRAALDAGGRTVAVLGTPIDDPTPRTNSRLALDIINNGGTIISEYPPGSAVFPANFSARNRIIAGLSKMTAVTEGTKSSGSLITASYAKSYGRVVAAVPGQIDSPLSAGPNLLIRQGAMPLERSEDIFPYFGLDISVDTGSTLEHTILAFLDAPRSLTDIKEAVDLEEEKLLGLITELELKGLIVGRGQQRYERTR